MQKGFTLAELMVSVAVVGILSRVAIGKYQNYKAKTRVIEAKVTLAKVYEGETSYFAENNAYTSCVQNLGMDIPDTLDRWYAVGWGLNDPIVASCPAPSYGTVNTYWSTFWPNTKSANGVALTSSHWPPGGPIITANTYVCLAHGFIVNNPSSSSYDGWTIDQNKILTNYNKYVLP